MIVGAKGAGKTEVSKYLAQNYSVMALNYEKFAAQKQKELATEDDDEELPFAKLLVQFKKELDNGDSSRDLIFDGWPADKEGWDF